MLSSPPPEEPQDAARLRGLLYTDLDRLAFALEMECAERLARGDERAATSLQAQRLGIRLAQRLVSGVWAPEVNPRLRRWEDLYRERLTVTP